MKKTFTLIESNLNEITQILNSHKSFLAYPMDSYCEDKLSGNTIYRILHGGADIGYAGIIGDELRFFHVLLVSLIAGWDFIAEKEGCYFIDSGRQEKPWVEASGAQFRTTGHSDIPAIIEATGDFLDKMSPALVN